MSSPSTHLGALHCTRTHKRSAICMSHLIARDVGLMPKAALASRKYNASCQKVCVSYDQYSGWQWRHCHHVGVMAYWATS